MDKAQLLSTVEKSLLQQAPEKRKEIDRIIQAMTAVDRGCFARGDVYLDYPLPIGYGQTISQPSTVGAMLLEADLNPGQDVLEVGTGSGWNAALLAYLVHPGRVVSVERIMQLALDAREKIASLAKEVPALDDVHVLHADARTIQGTFDRIIFTAGIQEDEQRSLHRFAQKHLRDHGLMLLPRSHGPLLLFRKEGKHLQEEESKMGFVFVPLRKGLA